MLELRGEVKFQLHLADVFILSLEPAKGISSLQAGGIIDFDVLDFFVNVKHSSDLIFLDGYRYF